MAEKNSLLPFFWFLFAGSFILYGIIVYFVPIDRVLTENILMSDMAFYGFLALALIIVGFAHLTLPSALQATNPDGTLHPQKLLSLRIIQFAFSEATAIFGLILYTLTGHHYKFYSMAAIGAISLILLYPRR